MQEGSGGRLSELRRPSIWLALVAVVLATMGTAVAAKRFTGNSIVNGTITGVDVRNKSLTKKDFRGSVRGPARSARVPGREGHHRSCRRHRAHRPRWSCHWPGGRRPDGQLSEPADQAQCRRVVRAGDDHGPQSSNTNVPAGSDSVQATAICNPGEEVLSGGVDTLAVRRSTRCRRHQQGSHLFPGDPPTWTVYLANNHAPRRRR